VNNYTYTYNNNTNSTAGASPFTQRKVSQKWGFINKRVAGLNNEGYSVFVAELIATEEWEGLDDEAILCV